jgi:hypothetical chaperone protein
MGIKIGLDFGTSNSGAAVYDGQKIYVLPLDQLNLMPEVVKTILYVTRDNQAYIGQEAVELYYRHNVNRVRRYVKKWAGELDYVGSELHYVRDIYVYVDELKPGRLLQYLKTALRKMGGLEGYSGTQIFERYYTVKDLLATYLRILKSRSEQVLGEEISAVCLGRPVKFSKLTEADALANETLREAAHEAGFEQVDFELEPVAAALYYEHSIKHAQNALIFDFGGGTLDIAIMRLGIPGDREVYASGGIDIAGSDFDRAIIEKRMLPFFGGDHVSHQPEIQELIQAVPDWIALPEMSTPMNRHNLERAIQQGTAPVRLKRLLSLIFNDLAFSFYNNVEAGKIALSSQGSTVIALNEKDIDLWELYTRWQFEEDIRDFQERIEQVLLATLEEAGLEPGEIDVVVKTGGSSNIPTFSVMLARIFGPEKVIASNAFSSVVSGLAIRAFERS